MAVVTINVGFILGAKQGIIFDTKGIAGGSCGAPLISQILPFGIAHFKSREKNLKSFVKTFGN